MMSMRLEKKQRGFSLIEALVAFMVISVGMLGIASLQTVSLRAGSTAAVRSVAVIKAGEIIERMRANPTQVLSYAINASSAGADNGCTDNGTVTACTPAEMAADDIYHWLQDLKAAMPNNGSATVTITPPGAGDVLSLVNVTINWQERNADSQTLDNQSYSVSAEVCGALKC